MVRPTPGGEISKPRLPWTFKFDRALVALSLLHALSFLAVIYLRWGLWGASALIAWAVTALLFLCVSFARVLDLRSATYLESGAACGVFAITTFLGVTLLAVDYAPRFAMVSFVGIPVVVGVFGVLVANLERAPRHCYRCGRVLSTDGRVRCQHCMFGLTPTELELSLFQRLSETSEPVCEAILEGGGPLEQEPAFVTMGRVCAYMQDLLGERKKGEEVPPEAAAVTEVIGSTWTACWGAKEEDADAERACALIHCEYILPLYRCLAMRRRLFLEEPEYGERAWQPDNATPYPEEGM